MARPLGSMLPMGSAAFKPQREAIAGMSSMKVSPMARIHGSDHAFSRAQRHWARNAGRVHVGTHPMRLASGALSRGPMGSQGHRQDQEYSWRNFMAFKGLHKV